MPHLFLNQDNFDANFDFQTQNAIVTKQPHDCNKQVLNVDVISFLTGSGRIVSLLSTQRFIQTTDSKHHFWKYGNIAKDMSVTAPEQLWVSDVTYLLSNKGWMYLSLITDIFSRKIVGYAMIWKQPRLAMYEKWPWQEE